MKALALRPAGSLAPIETELAQLETELAQDRQIRAVSFGGGVQSMAMLVCAAERREHFDYRLFLFSNVGDDSEHPDTLTYFHEVALPYARANGIDLRELRSRPRGKETTLLERLENPDSRSVGIPVRIGLTNAPGTRSCTVDFKVRRIASHLKLMGATAENPAIVALGISLDEYQRASNSKIEWQENDFPLLHARMDRGECIRVIERAGLPVPPKSSCWFCPFHSLDKWRELRREQPALYARAIKLEQTLSERHMSLTRVNGESRGPVFFTNKRKPLEDALGDSEQLALEETTEDITCDIGGYCMS